MNLLLFDERHSRYILPRHNAIFRHITSVLRSSVGDVLRIGVVNGPRGSGVLSEIGADELVIEASWEGPNTPIPRPLPLRVVLGHPRPPVLRRLWRDLTALRVARIDVFVGDLAERSYLASSVWDGVDEAIRDGLSQSMHTVPPRIERWPSLDAALSAADDLDPTGVVRLFGQIDLDGDSNVPPFSSLGIAIGRARNPSVTLAIGPERGFTVREIEALRAAGYAGVGLGPSVLRTETAAIALTASAAALLWESTRCGRNDEALYLE